MTSSLRIAFIGAGRMANHHAGFLAQEPDVAIVAAADIDRARAEAFSGEVGRHALSRPPRHARCRGDRRRLHLHADGQPCAARPRRGRAQPAALRREAARPGSASLPPALSTAAEQRNAHHHDLLPVALRRRLSPRPGVDCRRSRCAGHAALVLDAAAHPVDVGSHIGRRPACRPEHPSRRRRPRAGGRRRDGLRGLQRTAGRTTSRSFATGMPTP